MENKEQRPIKDIAKEILEKWKNPYFGAKPYLNAMLNLTTIYDNYSYDSGRDIINYFLSNASYWRGEDARRIKAELKSML